MLRELRAASPSLRDFLRDVARVTSYDDLVALHQRCLLYTSDAADERSSVDLGGRRIIKKKNIYHYPSHQ